MAFAKPSLNAGHPTLGLKLTGYTRSADTSALTTHLPAPPCIVTTRPSLTDSQIEANTARIGHRIEILDINKVPTTLLSSSAPAPERVSSAFTHLTKGLAQEFGAKILSKAASAFTGISVIPDNPVVCLGERHVKLSDVRDFQDHFSIMMENSTQSLPQQLTTNPTKLPLLNLLSLIKPY